MRILIAAGGTGGHLLPGISVGQVLRARNHTVHFVVKRDAGSQGLLAREGFPSTAFQFEGFPRALSWKSLVYPFKAAAAWAAARRIMAREAPDVFLGMGGYVSVPAGLAALRRKIPLVVHEQNTRAGLANRLLSRWARAVATSFESTSGLSPRRGRVVWTGLPLRPDLTPQDPAEARRRLGLDPEAFTLLLFGGSQGARTLNALFLEALPGLVRDRPGWQYIHLTGVREEEALRAAYGKLPCRAFVRGFHPDMATLYSAADFVVGRAGANTVMELKRMGRAALLVPFPHATDQHQLSNARFLEWEGQAKVIEEKSLSAQSLGDLLRSLPEARVFRQEAGERLGRVSRTLTEAAARLADVVEEAVV